MKRNVKHKKDFAAELKNTLEKANHEPPNFMVKSLSHLGK